MKKFALLLAAAGMIWAQGGAGKQGGAGAGKQGKGGAPAAAPQMISMIKPGLYVVTGAGGNTTVRVTKDGLIVVDTKNLGDQFYQALMAQIKTVSDKPVKYVIVTHHHQDHSGNIKQFKDAGATVIANQGLAKALETYNPQQGKPAQPSVTYLKDKTVKLGGVKVQVYHFSQGHTGGDSIVYFPDLKVVSAGDDVVGVVPNIDFPFGGSLIGLQTTLNAIAKLNFDTLVPGHSAPNTITMSKADFMKYKSNIDTIIARGKELVKSGTPKDQLLAKLKTDDLGWNLNTPQWTPSARLDALYEELKTAK